MKKFDYTLLLLISLYFFSCGNDKTSIKDSIPSSETNRDDAKILFKENCVVCHGEDGTAGIANAANLQTSRMDSTEIYILINNGKSSMPAFGEQLSKEEIKKLRTYVQTLRK